MPVDQPAGRGGGRPGAREADHAGLPEERVRRVQHRSRSPTRRPPRQRRPAGRRHQAARRRGGPARHGTDQLAASLGKIAAGPTELEEGTASLRAAADEVAAGAGAPRRARAGCTGGPTTWPAAGATLARRAAASRRGRQGPRGAGRVADGAGALARGSARVTAELAGLAALCLRGSGRPPVFCEASSGPRPGRVTPAASRAWRGDRGLGAANDAVAAGAAGPSPPASAGSAGGSAVARRRQRPAQHAAPATPGVRRPVARRRRGAGRRPAARWPPAPPAAGAAGSLASGSATLSSSASDRDGAQQLSSGLAKGAEESPTYSDSQQDALATAVSQPVELTSSLQHDEHGNGWLLALVLGLALWLAALAGALRRDVGAALGTPWRRCPRAGSRSRAARRWSGAGPDSRRARGPRALPRRPRPWCRSCCSRARRGVVRRCWPSRCGSSSAGRGSRLRAGPARPGGGARQRRTPRDGAGRAAAANGVLPLTAYINAGSQLVERRSRRVAAGGGPRAGGVGGGGVRRLGAAGQAAPRPPPDHRPGCGRRDGGVRPPARRTAWVLLAVILVVQGVLLVWHRGHDSRSRTSCRS